jgi:probable rRNA maturation factor
VFVLNRQRSRGVDRARLLAYLRRIVERKPPVSPSELTVCLVSDRKMREFNREYRERDCPTDVLSFPSDEVHPADGRRYLGDIAISVETAERQADRVGHSLQRELELLALHGYLHLLGYDHETDDGEMMRLQEQIDQTLRAAGRTPMRERGS